MFNVGSTRSCGGSVCFFFVVIKLYRALAALLHQSPSLTSDPALFICAIYKRLAVVNSFLCRLMQKYTAHNKRLLLLKRPYWNIDNGDL
jgi:hypothetical protein